MAYVGRLVRHRSIRHCPCTVGCPSPSVQIHCRKCTWRLIRMTCHLAAQTHSVCPEALHSHLLQTQSLYSRIKSSAYFKQPNAENNDVVRIAMHISENYCPSGHSFVGLTLMLLPVTTPHYHTLGHQSNVQATTVVLTMLS